MIWSGPVAHEQGASVMSSLPACFASGRSAQRNRLFGEGVACRWLAAVVAVGAEAVFEDFDACAQGGVLFLQNDNLPLQSRDQRENGVGSLVIERLECVACAHIGFHESQTQRVAPMLRICKYITSRLRRAQQAAPLQMPGRLFFYSP